MIVAKPKKPKAKKPKLKREYRTRKLPPWMTGEIRCGECIHWEQDGNDPDFGRCSLLNAYREPEEWCERARRKKEGS